MDNKALTVIYGANPYEMTKKLLDYLEPFSDLNREALIGLKPTA